MAEICGLTERELDMLERTYALFGTEELEFPGSYYGDVAVVDPRVARAVALRRWARRKGILDAPQAQDLRALLCAEINHAVMPYGPEATNAALSALTDFYDKYIGDKP